MSIDINTNITSQLLTNNLTTSTTQSLKTMEALATSKKITEEADAANSEISELAKAQTDGDNVASTNSQDGISALQTADSGLGCVQDNLQQIRDLTLQAANGTNNASDLTAIHKQISSLTDQINSTANSTSFNGKNLLDGSNTGMNIQAGANSDSRENSINIGSAFTSSTTSCLNIPTGSNLTEALSSSDSAAKLINNIDSAISMVSNQRSSVGAYQNQLSNNIKSLAVTQNNIAASQSTTSDTNYATATSNLIQTQIKQSASALLMAQANQTPSIALSLI